MKIVIHILNNVPFGNINGDQTGLPKQHVDGGVNRGRISPQSLKRAARTEYRDTTIFTDNPTYRTRKADQIAERYAREYAAEKGLDFTEETSKTVRKVIRAITTANIPKTDDEAAEKTPTLFLSEQSLRLLAQNAVEKPDPGVEDFILDATSSALDIAAFGRMFSAAYHLSTIAAVAVSPAETVHGINVAVDHFSTAEECTEDNHSSHLGSLFNTTGTYYRTVVIDPDQLRRSWSLIDTPEAAKELEALVRALIVSLPSGRKNSSAPPSYPSMVVAETQKKAFAYDFETPLLPAPTGGYTRPAIEAFVERQDEAHTFDPDNFGPTAYYVPKSFEDAELSGSRVPSLKELTGFVVDQILGGT